MAHEAETERRLLDRPQVATAVVIGAILTIMGLGGPVTGQEGVLVGFGRNYLHDFIHISSGLLGVGAGYYAGGRFAAAYNKYVGLTYLLVFVGGLVLFDTFAALINLNAADHWLHAFLAIVLAGVGFGLDDRV